MGSSRGMDGYECMGWVALEGRVAIRGMGGY
jgi:hypothetical protein